MKAIKTTYNGTEYRSRLEARWAMFFQEIGLCDFYEPFDIGKNGTSYVPDFFLHGLFFNDIAIAEIKPIKPNSEYIEYLKKVRIPGKSDFYIFVGEPSFYQHEGVLIYGSDKNLVDNGFMLTVCERCGYYANCYEGMCLCGCNYNPPSPDWELAAEKAKQFRFDLA